MPTNNPRVQVTLDPDSYATYKRFAELAERPLGSVIAEFLIEARPQFEKLGAILQEAHRLQERTDEERASFLHKLTFAQGAVHGSLVGMQSAIDFSSSEPAAGDRRARERATAASSHSLINRNKSPKPIQTRVPARSKAKKSRGANGTT